MRQRHDNIDHRALLAFVALVAAMMALAGCARTLRPKPLATLESERFSQTEMPSDESALGREAMLLHNAARGALAGGDEVEASELARLALIRYRTARAIEDGENDARDVAADIASLRGEIERLEKMAVVEPPPPADPRAQAELLLRDIERLRADAVRLNAPRYQPAPYKSAERSLKKARRVIAKGQHEASIPDLQRIRGAFERLRADAQAANDRITRLTAANTRMRAATNPETTDPEARRAMKKAERDLEKAQRAAARGRFDEAERLLASSTASFETARAKAPSTQVVTEVVVETPTTTTTTTTITPTTTTQATTPETAPPSKKTIKERLRSLVEEARALRADADKIGTKSAVAGLYLSATSSYEEGTTAIKERRYDDAERHLSQSIKTFKSAIEKTSPRNVPSRPKDPKNTTGTPPALGPKKVKTLGDR